MSDSINKKLDLLFEEWEPLCPDPFVRDGVVCEETFRREARRVVFVLAEPNYIEAVKAAGNDLRVFYRTVVSGRCFYQSLARWTRLLLDGQTVSFKGNPEGACAQLRRIATINLKKVGGAGSAVGGTVAAFAAEHCSLLVKQLDIIQPDVIVVCGGHARAGIPKVLGAPKTRTPDVAAIWKRLRLLPSHHPSCWTKPEAALDARLRDAWEATR